MAVCLLLVEFSSPEEPVSSLEDTFTSFSSVFACFRWFLFAFATETDLAYPFPDPITFLQ